MVLQQIHQFDAKNFPRTLDWAGPRHKTLLLNTLIGICFAYSVGVG